MCNCNLIRAEDWTKGGIEYPGIKDKESSPGAVQSSPSESQVEQNWNSSVRLLSPGKCVTLSWRTSTCDKGHPSGARTPGQVPVDDSDDNEWKRKLLLLERKLGGKCVWVGDQIEFSQ